MKPLIPLLCVFVLTAFAADPPEIPLWPNGAPGSENISLKETVEQVASGRRVSNVTNPTIAIHAPARDKATGAAVIVAPGGGHRYLTFDNEGHDVAKWLASVGVVGFVLKYRLARAEGNPFRVDEHVLQDTQRAIRLVRSRSAEWGIDPARVGVIGFSAGGELAALAATRYDDGNDSSTDVVERQKSRPDFVALLYPGLPRDRRITKDTPPMFLCAAHDDRPSISEGLAEYYLELKRAGVAVELHLFTGGGHGFGIRNRPFPVSGWPQRFQEWMGHLGLLKKP